MKAVLIIGIAVFWVGLCFCIWALLAAAATDADLRDEEIHG